MLLCNLLVCLGKTGGLSWLNCNCVCMCVYQCVCVCVHAHAYRVCVCVCGYDSYLFHFDLFDLSVFLLMAHLGKNCKAHDEQLIF